MSDNCGSHIFIVDVSSITEGFWESLLHQAIIQSANKVFFFTEENNTSDMESHLISYENVLSK